MMKLDAIFGFLKFKQVGLKVGALDSRAFNKAKPVKLVFLHSLEVEILINSFCSRLPRQFFFFFYGKKKKYNIIIGQLCRVASNFWTFVHTLYDCTIATRLAYGFVLIVELGKL